MSGFVNYLSPSQENALQNFRQEAKDLAGKPYTNDEYYLKWLRARKFDLEASLVMFRNHLEWRKKWNVDEIFNWEPPEALSLYMPGNFFGEDRKGHPVFYDFLGNLDTKGVYKCCKADEGFRYKILHAEQGNKRLQEQSEKYGRCIETITAIVNMENLSYHRQYHWDAIQLIRKVFSLFADNYPERTENVFVINAPRIFPLAYNLFKPFMDETTKRRVFILGDDYEEVLLQHIAPDQLPEIYGGERREPDAKCTDYLKWGGEVPEKYYLSNQTMVKKENMKKVTVGRGSAYEHMIEIKECGSILRWEFLTEDFDIGFSVVHKAIMNDDDDSNETITIVTNRRLNSHVVPEQGIYQCQTIGTYVLIFDNSHSWMRSKEVYYNIEYDEPDLTTGTVYGTDMITEGMDYNELLKEQSNDKGLEEDMSEAEV